jgi:hypothetical protein
MSTNNTEITNDRPNVGVVEKTPPTIKNTFFDDNENKVIFVQIKPNGDDAITIEGLGDNCRKLLAPDKFFEGKKTPYTTNGGKKQKSKQTKKSNKSRKAKKSKQSRKVHRK